MSVQLTLANRYAAAYLNLFDAQIDIAVCQRLEAAADFFSSHPAAMLVLKLSTVTVKEKRDGLEAVIKAFQLPKMLVRLVDLLLEQNRVELFPTVLTAVSSLYKKRHNITDYMVYTAGPLEKKALEVIISFLQRMTGKHILYTVKEDKGLIAGIRLQSDTTLWEYSIDKQLRQLQHKFNL